jgi:hypothetical protein
MPTGSPGMPMATLTLITATIIRDTTPPPRFDPAGRRD